jgi:hypothetical protein
MQNDSSGSTGFFVGKGENANVPTSNEECHFTNMCFTNLLGQPIIYVCIIKKESELTLSEALGFNYLAEWIPAEEGDTTDDKISRNVGPGKRYPGGTICRFNGVKIKTFVTHSSSGGITAEILTGILQRLDDLDVFQRSEGVPDPCVLLDGHGSRFENEFLS